MEGFIPEILESPKYSITKEGLKPKLYSGNIANHPDANNSMQIGLRLDVDCYEGPKDDTLIVTKNNYPKFDELLSILEKYNGRSMCTSYIDISFYKVNKYFGYTRNLGYKTIDFSASRSSYKDEKEAYNAIKQAKDWFKKKQKL